MTTSLWRVRLILLLSGFLSFSVTGFGQRVSTGIEVLEKQEFNILSGKRVGLITNPTGVDRNFRTTTDILYNASGINLVALYGPEHGVRGDFAAGDRIASSTDPLTGLPVFSLYGNTRKPTKEMLKGIDVLVYDIQDIGSRSYTYISTLGLAMDAAAENNIGFVVLDRPNPLGGEKMEGLITRPGFISFVSQFPIPYIHGLTVGELARFLNGESLLSNGIRCNLEVIPMKGWKRRMSFQQTGLPWVPTSPHIPHDYSPQFYPATGILGELYVMSIGVGYTLPFQLIAAEWIDAEKLAGNLNALHLPGLIFRPVHFSPFYSVSKGTMVHGVQVHFTDFRKVNLTLIQFYVLQECKKLWPGKNVFELCEKSRIRMFDQVCGSDTIRKTFSQTFTVESIRDIWMQETNAFREKVKKYMLYK